MSYGFYAMLFRMKYINRWSIMHTLVPENLSTHSMETAVIAHALSLIGNKYFSKSYNTDRIAAKALFHDVPEILTGDMPTPVKYHSEEMRKAYYEVEEAAFEMFMSMLPDELSCDYRALSDYDDDERTLIKSADKLCAYLKCIDESRSGNKEFEIAEKSTLNALKAMGCEEADYFLEHFLEPFKTPVDTLIKK